MRQTENEITSVSSLDLLYLQSCFTNVNTQARHLNNSVPKKKGKTLHCDFSVSFPMLLQVKVERMKLLSGERDSTVVSKGVIKGTTMQTGQKDHNGK